MKLTEYNDLPSEIIDTIFDELWNNTSSGPTWKGWAESAQAVQKQNALFRNCLQVSTDFRHRILSRACSNVILSPNPSRTHITRLRDVISQPRDSRLGGIGCYIKHFSIHYIVGWEDLRAIIRFFDNQGLVDILDGLHGEHFGVTGFSFIISAPSSTREFGLPWADIPASFRSAFLSLLRSPQLNQLFLGGVAFLSENVFRGSNLKILSIQQVPDVIAALSHAKEMELAPLAVSGFHSPSLVELNTDHSLECDSKFLPASMLEKLKVFKELPNERLHSAKTWRVLGLSASSLTEIYINHSGAVVNPPEAFNLGIVHNLEVFEYSRLSGSQHPFDSSTDRTPSILFHLLNVTEPMEYLKRIRIYFHLQESFVDEHFMQKTIADSSWASLDRVLTGPHFPCLRCLELFIRVAALLRDRSDFDKRAFLNTAKQRFKSSFNRIVAQDPVDIIFVLPIRISRSILNDPSYISDEYSDGTPVDTFDIYDDGYVSEEIDWDYEPSDDDEGPEEDYPTLDEFEGPF